MYLQKETSIMCCFLVVQNRLSIFIHIWLISFRQKLIICLAFLSNQFGQTARFQCKYSTRDVKQLPDQFIDQSILSITCIAWSEPYMIFIFQALNTCTSTSCMQMTSILKEYCGFINIHRSQFSGFNENRCVKGI